MVSRELSIVVAVMAHLTLAPAADADSAKLEAARKAIDEVRYDDAQRLLVGALADGGNSPEAVREIYKLSGNTAVVMGQRAVGEQYYRRWLALDGSAALGEDVAPKLREPFEAAQAFIAAHGRLVVTASSTKAGVIDIVVTQPMPMATAVSIVGGTPVPLSTENRVQLASSSDPRPVAVLDEHGNHLVVVAPPTSAPTAVLDQGPRSDEPPRPEPAIDLVKSPPSRTWIALAIPASVLIATGIGFGVAASNESSTVTYQVMNSRDHFYTDVADRQRGVKIYSAVAAGALSVGIVLAISATYAYVRSRRSPSVVPFVHPDAAGASVVGHF